LTIFNNAYYNILINNNAYLNSSVDYSNTYNKPTYPWAEAGSGLGLVGDELGLEGGVVQVDLDLATTVLVHIVLVVVLQGIGGGKSQVLSKTQQTWIQLNQIDKLISSRFFFHLWIFCHYKKLNFLNLRLQIYIGKHAYSPHFFFEARRKSDYYTFCRFQILDFQGLESGLVQNSHFLITKIPMIGLRLRLKVKIFND